MVESGGPSTTTDDNVMPPWLVRGSEEFAEMFSCKVCGAEALCSPSPGQAVCPDHCEDHDYKFDSGAGWPLCLHCSGSAPPDYYADDYDEDLRK